MMQDPNHNQAEMKRLVDLACDGALSQNEAARLDMLVCSDEQAAWFYTRYMVMHAMLERYEQHALERSPHASRFDIEKLGEHITLAQLAEIEAVSEEAHLVEMTDEMERREQIKRLQSRPARHVMPLGDAANGQYIFDPTPVRHYVIPKAAVYGAIAAMVAVAVFWSQGLVKRNANPSPIVGVQAQPVAVLTNASGAIWDGRFAVPKVGEELMPGELHLREGRVKIVFATGAEAYFEGPALIDLKRDNRMVLMAGTGSFHVPPTAVGFEVLTDSARVIDLGTDFAVRVRGNGVSDVHVFTGKVRASLQGKNDSFIDLTADMAQRFDAISGEVQPIQTSEYLFVDSWPTLNRIVRVTGDVVLHTGEVSSLEEFGLVTDQPVLVREREGVVLPSVVVGYTDTGRHTIDTPREVLVRGGTVVDSFLWRWKRPGEPEDREVVRVKGSMRFPRPIVGVITNYDQMIATDEICGLPGVTYAQSAYRQMDGESSRPIYYDYLTISDDRRSIEFDISLKGYDEFRVLIEAATEDEVGQ